MQNIELTSINDELFNKVEEIKLKAINTKQAYIDVAKLLFLQYQEMPTANRLYNLVKKGSMTTVVESMRIFWQEIQNQLSIKMHMPNIPQELQIMLSEQIEVIWSKSMEYAAGEFEQQRMEVLTKNENLEQEIVNLNNKIAEQEQQYQTLNSEYQAINEQNYQAKEKLIKYESQIQHEQNLQKDLYKKIAQLQTDINDNQQKFNHEKSELQSKFDLNIQALQHDIKTWQQRLDNERTQFKQQEKDFNKQNKLNQDMIKELQENINYERQQSSTLEKNIILLEQKYKELEIIAISHKNNELNNNKVRKILINKTNTGIRAFKKPNKK
ncbi:MAG: hypothetical protein RLZZ210_1836 [Pseudomonadota bacterium]|jgi:chromosome segregation ATPase